MLWVYFIILIVIIYILKQGMIGLWRVVSAWWEHLARCDTFHLEQTLVIPTWVFSEIYKLLLHWTLKLKVHIRWTQTTTAQVSSVLAGEKELKRGGLTWFSAAGTGGELGSVSSVRVCGSVATSCSTTLGSGNKKLLREGEKTTSSLFFPSSTVLCSVTRSSCSGVALRDGRLAPLIQVMRSPAPLPCPAT